MSFKTFSRNNPCPVCGKADTDCRYSADDLDFILCHTFADARKGEKINGFVCVKESNGHTASFKPDNSEEWSEERRREWADEQRRRLEQSQREQQQKLAQLLPIPERDKQYRHISATLGLSQKHRLSELSEHRGLNADEIDFALSQQWLCSWKPGAKVNASPSLAGVAAGQLAGVLGLGIAAVNSEGQITGFQLASDNRQKFGKYIWLSSASKGGNSPHLPNGELPVFVWRHPEAKEVTETWLVEGGLKSLITALKLWFRHGRTDIQIIGAAGGNWYGSINAVVEALGETSKVTLYPDAGSLNNAQILAHYHKIVETLTSKTYSVSVAWWGQLEKETGSDIDELENIFGFDLITPGEFFSLAKDADSKDENNDWAWRKWLQSRQYTPHMRVKLGKFRFPVEIPKEDAVIAVKSGLGSAKTEALIESIRITNRRAFLLGYRNNLLFQTGNRASNSGVSIYHLREDDGISFVADENTHIMACIDSIKHLDGYFKNTDIYLDESVSVLLHAVNGGTLGDEQAKVINILTKALQKCSRVILLDGNLSDIHVDFIAKISGKRAFKIENETKIPPHNFKFIVGIDTDGEVKKRDKSPLIKAMLSEGEIPWISSDSKNLTDVLDAIFKQQGRLNGYVLNKDTSGEEWAKEFLLDPDAFILKYKPDYFIVSPTAESGVSVTIQGHFTAKYTFFTGVQGTNSQHQMLFRLRNNSITHYVFCPEKSPIRDMNNPRTYAIKKFAETLNHKIVLSATLASEGTDSEAMLEAIGKAITRSDDDWLNLSCRLGALDNFEMDHLRDCLIHALEEAGHSVEILEWDIDDKFKELEESVKDAVRMRYALELYQAIEFETLEEANRIAKGNPKKETQRRIEKTRLLDRLPGIKDSDTWDVNFIADYYLKDKEFISKQQRFYLLNNFKVSRKRSEVNWYYLATNQDFFLGQAKRDSHLKIWALQQLNFLQFMDVEFHKDSPRVIELVERVRSDKDLALALGVQPNPPTESGKERIKFVKVLLDSIGLKTRKPVQKIINGVKHRVYSVNKDALNSPARVEVLEAISRKFDNYLQSESVAKVNWEETPVIEAEAAITEVIVPVEAAPVGALPPLPTLEQQYLQQSPVVAVTVEELQQESLVITQQSTVTSQQEVTEAMEKCQQESLVITQQPLVELEEQPRWTGLKFQVKQGLEVVGSLWAGLYKELTEKFGGAIGAVESEPWLNPFGEVWQVHLNFADGTRSIPIDWLELIS